MWIVSGVDMLGLQNSRSRAFSDGFSFTLFCYLNELSYLCTRNSLTPQTLSEERGGQGAR